MIVLQSTVLYFSRFLLNFPNLNAGVTVREQKSLPLQYSPTAYGRTNNTCVNTLTAGNIFFITAPSCIIRGVLVILP